MTLLYKADPVRGARWLEMFEQEAPDLEIRMWPDAGDFSRIRYLSAWTLEPGFIETLPNLEVLFSIGAGIDQLDTSLIPPHVDIVRLVENNLADGMAEYVTMTVLALHRALPDYLDAQAERQWRPLRYRATADRRVGIMGLGQMGEASLKALSAFGFQLRGWTRSARTITGVQCFHGEDGFVPFLAGCDILVCLLPLTDETRGILGRPLFDALPEGAMIVNAGRGGHLDAAALVGALNSGRLSRAILDVTPVEPLPSDDPLWRHPGVIVTPHIASATDAEGAGRALIANLRRHRAGEPMIGLVDRDRGY